MYQGRAKNLVSLYSDKNLKWVMKHFILISVFVYKKYIPKALCYDDDIQKNIVGYINSKDISYIFSIGM